MFEIIHPDHQLNAFRGRPAIGAVTLRNPAQSIFRVVDSHLKCKAGFCEDFEWGEIVESLSWSIVEPVRHVCKGVV